MNSYSVAAVIKATGADQFIRDFQNAQKSVESFVKANEKSFESMRTVGKAAMAGGLAIGTGLGFAVKTAANFEQAMSQVKAISGATGSNFESLRDKAIEMGKKTMFSASESADAMANLAQMGWKTDQILGGIEHTLNLAAAGGLELADSALLMANTMNQFGLETSDAERVADVFALTASSAGTDVTELGQALEYAGAGAAAAGMSVEETAAFIGVLGDAGVTGSKAGTSLNAMLRDLKASAEDGTVAVGDQSVALYDAEGNMRNMPDVIGEIISATNDMTTEQRDNALAAIFGEQALGGFNSIALQGADAVSNLAEELYDSNGVAKDMADVMMDNLNGALTELGSAFEGVQIAIGSALIPAIRLATEMLTKLADWFNNLSDTTKSAIAIFLAITSVVLTLGGAFLLLVGSLPFIMNGFTHLKNVLSLARVAMMKFNAAILANPMTWVVAAIVAAAALIYIYWEPIKDFFINLWDSIKEGAMYLWEVINDTWGGQIESLKNTVSTLVDHFVAIWTNIYESVQPIIESIVEFATNIWTTFVDWWGEMKQNLLTKASTLWEGINNAISIAVSTIVDFVMEIWGNLVQWWDEHGQMIQDAAMNVWTFISTIIGGTVGAIVAIIQFGFGLAQTIIMAVFDAIFAAVEFVWPYILSTITFVVDGIWALMQFLWPFVEMLIIDTWNAIVNIITGAIDIILGIVQFFAALFTGNWTELWEATKQIFSGALSLLWGLINLWFVGKILKVVKSFTKMFSSVISSVWNVIKSLFTSGVNIAKNVVSTGFNFMRSIISNVMNAIRSIISSIWNSVRSVTTSVVNSIRSVISNVFNAIRSVISGVMNSIRSTISSIWNAIRSVITSVTNSIRSTISNIFNSLRGIVSGAMSGVRGAVSSGMKAALNVVNNMVKNFFNAGKNIVGAIADGIKATVGKVTGAMGDLASKARAFLPFSPAKEGAFRDIMKIQIPQSIAKSIERGKGTAFRAMDNLTSGMNDRMNINGRVSSLDGMSRTVNRELNAQLNVGKQPAIINVHVGSKQIASEIVDDITEIQDRNKFIKESFT